MVKCDNCEKDAAYTQADPGVNAVNYCPTCLPQWLYDRAVSGHFPLVTPVSETPKTLKKKASVSEDTTSTDEDKTSISEDKTSTNEGN